MGVFQLWGKALAYPFIRTSKDVKTSWEHIKHDQQSMRELKDERIKEAEAAHKYLQDLTASEKFEKVYELNKWDKEQLAQQLIAVHRTRIWLFIMAVCVVLLFFFVLSVAPLWSLLIFFPMAIFGPAVFLGLSIKFAWHEWQIVNRKIIPFSDFRSMDLLHLLMQFKTYKPDPLWTDPQPSQTQPTSKTEE